MVDFQIRVVVDPSGAQRGTRQVGRSLGKMEKTALRVAKSVAAAFGAFALGAGILNGIRLLASFDQELSNVAAISGATKAEFEELSRVAQELGANTRFSASEAAQGLTFLARAGFSVRESIEAVDDTLLLAQAGGLGLGSAADIASNALQGFRLDVDQAARVVDVLALTANSSNTNVQQLGNALSFVAPIAAGLGVSIEESSAAIGALSNAGLQASRAGTGLRRVLGELESPSKKTKEIFEDLGVSFKDVKISQVGLTAALRELANAGVDTGQALEIFGDRGGPAFEVLSSSIPDVVRMTEELGNAEGAAKRTAGVMDDNLNGAILAVKSAFQGLVLALGDSGATGGLTKFFRSVASGTRLIIANIDTLVNSIQAMSAALAISLAQKAIPAAIAALNRLRISLLANPFTFVAAAATIAAGAIIGFADQIKIAEGEVTSLEDVFVATFDVLGGIASELASEIEIVFQALNDTLGGVFGDVEISIVGVLELLALVTDRGLGFFVGLGDAMRIAFLGIGDAVAEVAIGSVNAVIRTFEKMLDVSRAAFSTIGKQSASIGTGILDFFRSIGAALQILATGQASAAVDIANVAIQTLGLSLTRSVANIPVVFGKELEKLSKDDSIAEIENAFAGASESLGDAVLNGFLDGLDVGLVRGILDDIIQRAKEAAEAAKEAREAAQGDGGGGGSPGGGAAPGAGGGASEFENAQRTLQDLQRDGIITSDELTAALERLRVKYGETGDAASFAAEGFGEFQEIAQTIAQFAVDSFADSLNTIGQAFVGFTSSSEDAGDAFEELGDRLLDSFSSLIDSLIEQLAILAAQKALIALVGGESTELGTLLAGTRAEGGDVSPGKRFLVGERGPEIFEPSSSGTIVPAGESAAFIAGMDSSNRPSQPINVMAAPAQVQVVNVSDPNEVPNGIESTAGQQSIMNVIKRNRRQISATLPRN